MNLIPFSFGVVGVAIMAAMMYYSVLILDHLRGPEGSLATFFVDDRMPLAFEVMAGSLLIFSTGMFYGAIGFLLDKLMLTSLSVLGALIGGLGFIYFFREMAIITEAHEGSAVVNRYLRS